MKPELKKVAFLTLGCKLNFSETSGIARQFETEGYLRVDGNEPADVVVINTCSVTEMANKKSKQAIRKMIHHNPNAKVIAVGCYSQLKPEEVAQIEGVDLILGSANKFSVLDYLKKLDEGHSVKIIDDEQMTGAFVPTYSFGDRTRSFLKVQDGCDYFCSYCTIPKARGRSRNNSIEATLLTASEIIEKGVREIILTGVNIGDFGRSTNEQFFDLIQQLSALNGLERLRISSIEPNLLTDEILKFVADSKVIVPHFHIPLQCGTDHLLRLMRRRYTTSVYRMRVEKIKSLLPDACIAADIIVGVPGETEEDYKQSCEFIQSLDISYLHVFTYSERENTLAAKMDNQVPVEIRKERSKLMHQIGEQLQSNFHRQHLGTIRPVLFEAQFDKKYIYGFTDNYIRVQVPVQEQLINTVRQVRLESQAGEGIVNGELI